MLPKIEAMLDFVHSSQAMGIITSPANIEEALVTGRGTTIVP
jgi:carbamate kinase